MWKSLIWAFLVLQLLSVPGSAQNQPRKPPPLEFSDSSTPRAFKDQLSHLVRAEQAGNLSELNSEIHLLALPHAQAWFSKYFRRADVVDLDEEYQHEFEEFRGQLIASLHDDQKPPLERLRLERLSVPPKAAAGTWMPFRPVPWVAYDLRFFFLGSSWIDWPLAFTEVDGAFRYVGTGRSPFWTRRLWLNEASEVMKAKLIKQIPPVYPVFAQQTHLEGTVRLRATIGIDGAVTELSVISGDPVLTQAALDAVRQWVYVPTLWDGQPVKVKTTIDVVFRLNSK